jgi:hypothetical protein
MSGMGDGHGRFLEHALMSRGAALPRSALAVRLSMLPSC